MSEFLEVAEYLPRERHEPMTARRLVDLGLESGLFTDRVAGKTPVQTLKSKLSIEIRRNGASSRFVRTKPGVFFLRDLAEPSRVYEAPPLRAPRSREWVMVFEAANFERVGRFQGIRKDWRKYYNALLRSGLCEAMPRLQAEATTSFKQVVTYVLVTRGSQVLAFKRGSYNRVEAMLRGAECIGFGGHVASGDRTIFSQDDVGLWDSATRELSEELELPRSDRLSLARRERIELVGVMNDDSSNLGERHIAFVFRYEVSDDPAWDRPARGEKSITQLRWIDLASETIRLANFEYWSQLCFRAYFPRAIESSAVYTLRRRSRLRPPRIIVVCGELGSRKGTVALRGSGFRACWPDDLTTLSPTG